MDNGKINRILSIYSKLMNGEVISKAEVAVNYDVSERSIQRDIDDIRNYVEIDAEGSGVINNIVYDRFQKGYRLERIYQKRLTNGEILAVCKILLDSRAFSKEEMENVLKKIIACCVPENDQKDVEALISNEIYHYVELRHKLQIIDQIWPIGQAVKNHQYIEMEYMRMKDKSVVKRKVRPVAIMFSEYYFYLTAFIEDEQVKAKFEVMDDSFPTIYRIDRIKNMNVLKEHFYMPYNSRFEEGEFRKRVQFMYGGRLRKVKFTYSGYDIDAVLDRLPTAEIINEDGGIYTVRVETFGKGIDMWLKSQGNFIKIIGDEKV